MLPLGFSRRANRLARTAAAFVVISVLSTGGLAAQSAPAGWTTKQAAGSVTYTPPSLAAGEVFFVTVFSPLPLSGQGLGAWLTQAMTNDPLRPGTPEGPPKLSRQDGDKVAAGTRIYRLAGGGQVGAIYTAVTVDGQRVSLTRIVFSARGNVLERYKGEAQRINSEVVDRAKRERAGDRASTSNANGRGGIRPGGDLVEGVYVGAQIYRSTWGERSQKVRYRFRLHLYRNGEYQLCDENDKPLRDGDGEYTYDAASGKIDLASTFNLKNSSIEPESDFCLLGRDAQGKPYLYGENDRGGGTLVTALRYEGPTKRPAPSAAKAATARAEAEARRYKWVTTPGKGVKRSQIAAILHEFDVETYYGGSGMGMNVTDEAYLLLTDGSVHRGLPVPPDQLDVARSKKNEPKAWGRWRAQGGRYQVAWASAPGRYVPLPGRKVLPGAPGTRLEGRWGAGSSSSSLMGSSYRLWGVTFGKDGRFVKDQRGGSGNSQFMQSGGQTAINTAYDDESSVTSAAGNGVVVVSKRGKRVPDGHRKGRYEIDGYTMTLRYDNGIVVRMPFFFGDVDHTTLWFEGNRLGRDEKKR